MTDQPPQEQPPYDHQRWLYEQNVRNAQRVHDKNDEFFHKINEAAINAANLALRMALLINGGAAIALLSFDGHLPPAKMAPVADTLLWFAWGVIASVAGIALAYFTNYCMAGIAASKIASYEQPFLTDGPSTWKWTLANRIFHVAAVLTGLASLVLFIVGMFSVRAALT